MQPSIVRLILFLLAGSLGATACHKPKSATESPTPSIQQKRAERAAEAPENIQQKWTLLNRIRQDDSLQIGRTLLNEQNQLGVVFDSSVAPDKAETRMQQVMTEMVRKFPNTDITVIAYESATPLRQLGSAHLNEQTGQVTYTPTP